LLWRRDGELQDGVAAGRSGIPKYYASIINAHQLWCVKKLHRSCMIPIRSYQLKNLQPIFINLTCLAPHRHAHPPSLSSKCHAEDKMAYRFRDI
jgi:hypothetical protein